MNKLRNNKKQKGFTLIELLISVFIFLVIMLGFVSVFGDMINAYRVAREMQRNLENAEFASNFVAKTLRTSTIVSIDNGGGLANESTIRVFDHSQQECMEFQFTTVAGRETLALVQRDDATPPIVEQACQGTSLLSTTIPLTTGEVRGRFSFVQSHRDDFTTAPFEGYVGRATLFFEIESDLDSDDRLQYVQTSVSLRDYGYAGLSF